MRKSLCNHLQEMIYGQRSDVGILSARVGPMFTKYSLNLFTISSLSELQFSFLSVGPADNRSLVLELFVGPADNRSLVFNSLQPTSH